MSNVLNSKLEFPTRRIFGATLLSLSVAALSACGGGSKEAPTSESHLYQSLQLLRVGMTLGDAENIIGRAPDQWLQRRVAWVEGNESLVFHTISGQSIERISSLTWVWGVGDSASYQFSGEDGAMPVLLTSS